MNYYLDTEFLEGKQDKQFLGIKYGETKPTIDLISIGIVAEDGRQYYAISKDFNLKEAWNRNDLDPNHKRNYKQKDNYWIRENVLKPIFNEWMIEYNGKIVRLGLPIPLESNEFTYKNFKKWLKLKGKTNKHISTEIKNFVYSENRESGGQIVLESFIPNIYPEPEFYTYYGAYDWVVFCWLFGKMIDLPKGFPMYSKDLKQILDEKVSVFCAKEIQDTSFESAVKRIKMHKDYPKQTNEHNVLADARWNLKLYQFLNSL